MISVFKTLPKIAKVWCVHPFIFLEKGCKFLLRCGGLVGAPYLTFEWLLGWIFYPLAFVMGVPCGKTRLPDVFNAAIMLQKVAMIVFRAQKLTFISQQC